jgi:carbon-monoxide dehydrogenase medium subunit
LIPGSFDYLAAHSINEAVAMLDQHGEGAKVLAGGQSLIPLLRFRLASPTVLIDINRIDGLEYLRSR